MKIPAREILAGIFFVPQIFAGKKADCADADLFYRRNKIKSKIKRATFSGSSKKYFICFIC
jgi:hypothetical protein